jgi:hypothetical protein
LINAFTTGIPITSKEFGYNRRKRRNTKVTMFRLLKCILTLEMISMKKIITEKYFLCFLTFLLVFGMSSSSATAVTVSSIDLNPSTLIYNDIFECVLNVDVDDPNLSCGLLRVDDPDDKKPWNICPSNKDGSILGHRPTDPFDGKRHYNCVIGTQTGVPGPGSYRIVAWKFYNDGANGDIIKELPVSVLAKPPATHTPVPTKTPIPTKKPTTTPTRIPSPTRTPARTPTPESSFSDEEDVWNNAPPTPTAVEFTDQDDPNIPSESPINEASQSPVPAAQDFFPFSFPSFSLTPVVEHTKRIMQKTASFGIDQSKNVQNFLFSVVINFMAETSF